MTIVLPIIAILSVTSEWSQRSGLTTFTLVPHRGRVRRQGHRLRRVVGVVTIPVAFAVGAVGNLVGTAIAGTDPVWDLTPADLGAIALAHLLSLLVGFMLGVVIRASAGAIVAYFLYAFVLPVPVHAAGRFPGLVRRPAALGRLRPQPEGPPQRDARRRAVGPARR